VEKELFSVDQAPLKGIRVADFSWVWAGPHCTTLLADMGAEIIKVESQGRVDLRRILPPFAFGKMHVDQSGLFVNYNRGKLSCTLNLAKPRAIELAKQIAKISDFVVENFSPGVMERLGLGYDVLKETKKDIIMISMPGLGSSGPDKDNVTYGATLEALSGMSALTGYPGGPPSTIVVPLADPIAGLHAAGAALAALHHRSKTGEGQHIELSQLETTICCLPEAVMEYTMNGREWPRLGNRDVAMAPHGCYRCKGDDKWVAIAVSSEVEWQGLCKAMGVPQWSKEDRFCDILSRRKNHDELDRLIESWTIGYTHYEVMETLQRHGVASGPSLNSEELVKDPHLRERGFFVEVDHPAVGKRLISGLSFSLNATPGGISRPAPLLGQHNEYVFGELLGMSRNEIARLEEEQVIY
jgi:benzylsuccinate CoA-transferase BbsF subunit